MNSLQKTCKNCGDSSLHLFCSKECEDQFDRENFGKDYPTSTMKVGVQRLRCHHCGGRCESVFWGASGYPYCSIVHMEEKEKYPLGIFDKGLADYRKETRAQGATPRKKR